MRVQKVEEAPPTPQNPLYDLGSMRIDGAVNMIGGAVGSQEAKGNSYTFIIAAGSPQRVTA